MTPCGDAGLVDPYGDGTACIAPASCADALALDPNAATGPTTLDVDGLGPLDPFDAYCDHDHDGGGWTLLWSAVGTTGGPDTMSEGVVMPGDHAYVPPNRMLPLATAAARVHIRAAGDPARSVTSVANAQPIVNLRQSRLLNLGATTAMWTGPHATDAYLASTCAQDIRNYPHLYWGCGNNVGLHLIDQKARWIYSFEDAPNEPMEVWIR